MRKHLLALVAIMSISCAVFAQGTRPKLSIGPEAGLPLGQVHDNFSFILGGSIKLEVPIEVTNLNLTFTGGYTNFFGKTIGSFKVNNVQFVPVKAGLKYFVNSGFYVEGEAGIAASTQSTGGTAFAYAPGLGVSLPIDGDKSAVDVGVRFESWSNNGVVNQLALRLAYKFGL